MVRYQRAKNKKKLQIYPDPKTVEAVDVTDLSVFTISEKQDEFTVIEDSHCYISSGHLPESFD